MDELLLYEISHYVDYISKTQLESKWGGSVKMHSMVGQLQRAHLEVCVGPQTLAFEGCTPPFLFTKNRKHIHSVCAQVSLNEYGGKKGK